VCLLAGATDTGKEVDRERENEIERNIYREIKRDGETVNGVTKYAAKQTAMRQDKTKPNLTGAVRCTGRRVGTVCRGRGRKEGSKLYI